MNDRDEKKRDEKIIAEAIWRARFSMRGGAELDEAVTIAIRYAIRAARRKPSKPRVKRGRMKQLPLFGEKEKKR